MRLGSADTEKQVAVVAELGNNHEGDMAVARELVERAAECGVHAVKLQAIEPRLLVRPQETARIEQLERYRLDPDQFAELADLARSLGLGFSCTPFHLDAVDWLEPLVDAFKIASGDNDVLPLIESCARTGNPVIVSLGMSGAAEGRRARDVVHAAGAEFAALHCVSAYPAPPEAAHLATIPWLIGELDCTVGYSDHTLGIEACVAAAALGARILEKHFTLDHEFSDFRDHQLSAEPAEMSELVRRVALAGSLVGAPADGMLPEEEAVAAAARRSICAAGDLEQGHVLEPGDLTCLRPAEGMSPGREHELVGRALRRPVTFGEPLSPDDVS